MFEIQASDGETDEFVSQEEQTVEDGTPEETEGEKSQKEGKSPDEKFKGFLTENPDAEEVLRRMVQSEVDRREARRLREERSKSAETAEQQRRLERERRLRELEESGDFETLGKEKLAEERERKNFEEGYRAAAISIEQALAKVDAINELGDETVNRLYFEVLESKGDLVDYIGKLMSETASRARDAALKEAKAELTKEAEAAGVEEAAAQRAESGAPEVELTRAGSSLKLKSMTHDQRRKAYVEGDISWEDYKPYAEEYAKKNNITY